MYGLQSAHFRLSEFWVAYVEMSDLEHWGFFSFTLCRTQWLQTGLNQGSHGSHQQRAPCNPMILCGDEGSVGAPTRTAESQVASALLSPSFPVTVCQRSRGISSGAARCDSRTLLRSLRSSLTLQALQLFRNLREVKGAGQGKE